MAALDRESSRPPGVPMEDGCDHGIGGSRIRSALKVSSSVGNAHGGVTVEENPGARAIAANRTTAECLHPSEEKLGATASMGLFAITQVQEPRDGRNHFRAGVIEQVKAEQAGSAPEARIAVDVAKAAVGGIVAGRDPIVVRPSYLWLLFLRSRNDGQGGSHHAVPLSGSSPWCRLGARRKLRLRIESSARRAEHSS